MPPCSHLVREGKKGGGGGGKGENGRGKSKKKKSLTKDLNLLCLVQQPRS